jgi:hypothetical protein
VVHVHDPGDPPAACAGLEALEGLGLLVIGELRLAAEAGAFGLGGNTAVVGSLEDPAKMSPVPSASMARSSSGRFVTDLPLTFSR